MPDLPYEIATLRRLLEAQQIATQSALGRAERAETLLAAHMETCVTEQICIDKIVKDRKAAEARAERAESALRRILEYMGDDQERDDYFGPPEWLALVEEARKCLSKRVKK